MGCHIVPGRSLPGHMKTTILALSLTACATIEPPQFEVDQSINGATSPASQYMLDRAVKIPKCTATRISARFAITALHCAPREGNLIHFYTSGPDRDPFRQARIAKVIPRPGAQTSTCRDGNLTCTDSTGLFADVALLRLSDIEATDDFVAGATATLAWKYPGDGVIGKKVGAGGHGGGGNPLGILLQVSDTTDSSDVAGGSFDTTSDGVDPGDSGGPFYVGTHVMGVLHGHVVGDFARYTSVSKHLDWILTEMNFTWRGQPPQQNTRYTGSLVEAFLGTKQMCQYACEKTASCEAYNHHPSLSSCELVTNVTGASTATGFSSALRHGASAGTSNEVVGYVRDDGKSAVLHKATSGHVHQLLLTAGSWSWGVLASDAPAIAGKLSAYRRTDGVDAVVYRSTSSRIIELSLASGVWSWADLTSFGGQTAAGDPTAYVRADGVNAVVFRSGDGHINELRLGTRQWLATDLTVASGSTVVASSDPSAFTRSDGFSSVVFRAGSSILELYQPIGGAWALGGPQALAGAPAAASRPFGFTHSDGTNAIVYRSTANQVIELFNTSNGWRYGNITGSTAIATGNPTAYVRTDGVESVVYRTSTNKIHEATLGSAWQLWNLTTSTNAANTTLEPSVYIRDDGYNVVLFGLAGNQVGELFYKRGGSWGRSNLTTAANETP
jgi:Trypsin/PAN domain